MAGGRLASAMRSALPATRQAAGAPSAWSQPSQSTHTRPRRWCDAGSPGRQCVTAAQKAGDAGMVRNHSSALCRTHVPWATEPTRVATPPSPAGRRRYKHRSALCNARFSRTMEPTRIGTPSGGALHPGSPGYEGMVRSRRYPAGAGAAFRAKTGSRAAPGTRTRSISGSMVARTGSSPARSPSIW